MSLFANFGAQRPQGPNFFGQRQRPTDPSEFTTLAVGEEGGGGVATTLALGEEGGGNDNFYTNDVLNVFDRTDVSGQPGPTDAPTADGHLTRKEIRSRLNSLEQIRNIRFDPQRAHEINVLNFLDRNFDAIAGPDLHQEFIFAPIESQPAPVRSITEAEIIRAAGNDGNSNDLGDQDLRFRPRPRPRPRPGGGGFNFQMIQQLFKIMMLLLNNQGFQGGGYNNLR